MRIFIIMGLLISVFLPSVMAREACLPLWGVYEISETDTMVHLKFKRRLTDVPFDGAPGTTSAVHNGYKKVYWDDAYRLMGIGAGPLAAISDSMMGMLVELGISGTHLDRSRSILAFGSSLNPGGLADCVPYDIYLNKRR